MKSKFLDYNVEILDNGMNLITIKKDTQLASINLGIKIGSIYEKKHERGISHFIEHMLFKGTSSRKNEKLNEELEFLGGEYNAYTDYDCTVYNIVSLKKEMEEALEILSDMIQNSCFPKEELEKERDVILAEIRTSKDDLEDYSFMKTNCIGFDKSPLKYDIMGLEENINKFKKEDLINFYKKYYVPNNSYLSIVSNYDHCYVKEIVNKYFSCWKKQEIEFNPITIEKNINTKKISYKKDIEQSTITFLYTFNNINKKQEMALRILNHRLGQSTNSILFRELREKNGLAYDIYTSINLSKNVKTLYIYTSVAKKNVDKALKVIENCINRVKNKEITFEEKDIELMKKVLKTAVSFTMEDCNALGEYALDEVMEGESIIQFEEDIVKLEKIKEEDIVQVANLALNDPTIHILVCEGDY